MARYMCIKCKNVQESTTNFTQKPIICFACGCRILSKLPPPIVRRHETG